MPQLEKPLYTPANGIALVEIDSKTGTVVPIKVHEINFAERIYSHRKDFEAPAKAVDKTFVSGELQQKLVRISQDLCFSGFTQAEPTEPIAKEYFLSIRFIPIGKQKFLECDFYFNRRLEKKGKVREIFDQFMALEKAASEFR